jgi:hypothetical protein
MRCLIQITLHLLTFTTLVIASAAGADVVPQTDRQRAEMTKQQILKWLNPGALRPWDNKGFELPPHLLFKDRDEAKAWVQTLVPQFSLAFGDTDMKIVDTDPRYDVLDGYTAELWQAFTQLFPKQTAGMRQPPVVLIESKVVNAFVPSAPGGAQVGHVIVVFTGFLDAVAKTGSLDANMITGVFGHELGHSVFLHGMPSYQSAINRFYSKAAVSMGYASTRDAGLEAKMGTWLTNAHLIGDLGLAELHDLPSQGLAHPMLFNAWKQITADNAGRSAQCASAQSHFGKWSDAMRMSSLNSAIEVDPGERGAFAASGDELMASGRSCLSGVEVSLVDAIAKSSGIPAEVFKRSPEFMEMAKQFESAADPIEGLRKLVAPARVEMRQIEQEVDFSGVGFYTYEEHADEVSALVHAYMHRRPDSVSTFFAALMESQSQHDWKQCQAALDSGQEPANGAFSDPHRSTCYRIYHLKRFTERLQQGDLTKFTEEFLHLTVPGLAM